MDKHSVSIYSTLMRSDCYADAIAKNNCILVLQIPVAAFLLFDSRSTNLFGYTVQFSLQSQRNKTEGHQGFSMILYW